jgi:hypothetical protein
MACDFNGIGRTYRLLDLAMKYFGVHANTLLVANKYLITESRPPSSYRVQHRGSSKLMKDFPRHKYSQTLI